MKYTFNGTEYTDIDEVLSDLIDELSDDEEGYDDWLDEIYGEVTMGSHSWSPSKVLQEMDPIAYRCGIDDYTNGYYRDIKYELERASDGDTVYTPVGDIDVYEEEDDEDE